MQCEGPQIELYPVLFTLNVTITTTEDGSRNGIQDLGTVTSLIILFQVFEFYRIQFFLEKGGVQAISGIVRKIRSTMTQFTQTHYIHY